MLACCVAVLALAFPLNVQANPDQLRVTPQSHDFGEVEVGETDSVTIKLENINGSAVIVHSIVFLSPSSGDFVADCPTGEFVLEIAEYLECQVVYAPSSEGSAQAVLQISSSDWLNPEQFIALDGTGIVTQPSPLTIEDILAFFDAGVEAGTIKGKGPACSKDAHLKVFRFKLLMVAFFIDKDWMKGACQLLWHAYERSDGQDCPKDWIRNGPRSDDVDELNAMILQLLSDMGCM
jgi:hypothetical protein